MRQCSKHDGSPLISIIVPVFNVEKYLRQSVDSILNQSYGNLEVILVDDGSTDSSGAICDGYALKDSRITVIHKKNGGQGQARNAGVEICTGDYLAFLDSDDYMEGRCIEVLYGLISDNNADVSVCNYNYVSEDGVFIRRFSSGVQDAIFNGYEVLSMMWNDSTISLAPWAKLFRRGFWGDFRFRECYAEDAASMPYLFKEDTTVAYTGKALVDYRLRPTSDVRSFSGNKLNLLDIFDELSEYSEKRLPGNLQAILRGKKVAVNLHVFFQLPENGYDDERRRIRKTVRENRWRVVFSPLVRKKTRIAAFMTLFGYKLTKAVFLKLKKRDPSI
jgi:glycosyltransferase involved in cell wall biosynthesis